MEKQAGKIFAICKFFLNRDPGGGSFFCKANWEILHPAVIKKDIFICNRPVYTRSFRSNILATYFHRLFKGLQANELIVIFRVGKGGIFFQREKFHFCIFLYRYYFFIK